MKPWWSAAELAGMPGMPGTERGVQLKAGRAGWKSQPRSGRGGGQEYHLTSLPPATREHIMAQAVSGGVETISSAAGGISSLPLPAVIPEGRGHTRALSTSAVPPAKAPSLSHGAGTGSLEQGGDTPRARALPPAAPLFSHLKDWQRQCMEARAALVAEVSRLQAALHVSMSAGSTALVAAIREGTAEPRIAALVPAANARAGKTGARTLSRATLINWCNAHAEGGAAALAPRPSRESEIPDWAPDLLRLWGRPQKPSLLGIVEQDLPAALAGSGIAAPTYDQARRFLDSCSNLTRHQGRMGPRALKAMRAYRARSTDNLWPTAVYVPDGHSFDAEVAHPAHGQPFRPEITTIIDAFTRRVAGWSVALAENTIAVADAYRHAFSTTGICAIAYSDRGPGEKNAALDDPVTGLLARLEVTHEFGIPRNPQGHGIIERLNQSLWVKAAKTLPTYMGAAMDDEARQRAFKVTRKEIKEFGRSRLLIDWPEFMRLCEEAVAAYNARPHRGLPKVRGEDGRKRHMSPDEMWDRAVAEGFVPDVLTEAEAQDLFRPQIRRKTRRGLVSWLGNSYYLPALEHRHGEEVLVGYDIHDAHRVWVRDIEGRLIGEALWNGHRTEFYPVSKMRQAAEKRAQGRIRRLDVQRAEIEAELNPAALIEHAPVMPLDAEALEMADAEIAAMAARAEPVQPAAQIVQHPNARPNFFSDLEWASWLADHPDRATDDDRRLLAERLGMGEFRMLLEMEGISIDPLKSLAA
ncbi:MAG: Mu transposase C-terminal domain-containing protein [Magnetospirillum sp. WYHS-4]